MITLTDRRAGVAPRVAINSNTLVLTNETEEPYTADRFPLEAGQPIQVVGLRHDDGTIEATRIFL